jgi:conjugal transfer pilus assembly protein TrbC
MNTRRFQALFASGLLLSMSVSFASDQVAVNGRDREWMKQQQNALQEFKESLSGQTMALPPAQQDLVEKLQQGIRNDQTAQGGENSALRMPFTLSASVSPGRSVTHAAGCCSIKDTGDITRPR